MQERRLLPKEWVKKLQAVEIKFEELRKNFPYDHEGEQAIRDIGQYIKDQEKDLHASGLSFSYSIAQEVFRQLT
jgi:hypothetical protein